MYIYIYMSINTFLSCSQVHKRKHACTISLCAITSASFVENETLPTGRQRERGEQKRVRERMRQRPRKRQRERERMNAHPRILCI